MGRKERPTRVYRHEIYDRPGSTYLNSTSQYFNMPSWWPGPLEETDEEGRRDVFIEGQIIWEVEDGGT